MDKLVGGFIFQPTVLDGPLRKFPDGVEDQNDVYWPLWKATGVPCLRIEPPQGEARVAVVFYHGNAGTITSSLGYARDIAARAQAVVFIVEYPGYWVNSAGRVEKSPDAAGLYDAALRAARFVRSATSLPLVIVGFSLGCSIASRVAKELGAAAAQGVALVAPMRSLATLAVDKFAVAGAMMWALSMMDTFQTEMDAAECYQPFALVVHSVADEVIPHDHGRTCVPAIRPRTRIRIIYGRTPVRAGSSKDSRMGNC